MKRGTRFIGCVVMGLLMAAVPLRATIAATEPTGLIVEGIVADSAAAKAGLKVGDVLLTFEGRELTTLVALQAVQQNSVGKKEGVLQVRRGETTLTVNVPTGTLGALVRPELSLAALTHYKEARAALAAEKQAEAIDALVKAAEEAEKSETHAVAAWLYWSAGSVHEGQERWNEAQKLNAPAWRLASESRDVALKIKVLESLGWCGRNLSKYTEAAKWYEQALQLSTGTGYEMWAADHLTALGRIGLETREFQVAHDWFNRALKIYQRLTPQSEDVASSLGLLSSAAYLGSEFQAAQDYLLDALKIYEQINASSEDVARSYNNLGSIAYKRGKLDDAQQHFERARVIRERIDPDSLEVADTLSNLGSVAYFRGDLHAAQVNFRDALNIRRKQVPGSLLEADSLNSQGNIFYSTDNLPAAQKSYNDALKIQEHLAPGSLEVATSLNNLGNVAYFSNKLDEAQGYHRRAFEIRDRLAPGSLEVADSLNNLGSIAYLRGELVAAKRYHHRALEIKERLAPGSLVVAIGLATLGRDLFKEGDFREALRLFTDAVNIVETERSRISSIEGRALLVARHTYPYIGLVETNLALNDAPAAFAVTERAHTRSFIELLSERPPDFRRDIPAELVKRQNEIDQNRSSNYVSLRDTDTILRAKNSELERLKLGGGDAKRINELNGLVKDLKKRIEGLRIDLVKDTLRQRELEIQVRSVAPKAGTLQYPLPTSLADAQAALDADTLLLSYFIGLEQTYLFAVTKKAIKVYTLPAGETTLKGQVKAFRNEVANKRLDMSKLMEQGRSLYDLLVGQAQEPIDQAKRVLICPDGPLHMLPFAALLRQSSPRPRYFVEDKPLHTISSMAVYAEMRKLRAENGRQQKRILAFADPVNNLTKLPSALNEVVELRNLFGKSATVRLGRQATETAARTESNAYSILHFAVHGLLDDDVGLNSSLALSRPEMMGGTVTKDDNGLWQAWEIFEQPRLKADLVTLSACEANLGENVRGEGLIGLTRAFQYAGAKSVLVSLWEVNDESTAPLMKAFYRELQKGADKDIALQKASVTLRGQQKWEHPYHWAPFILVGDWQ
jgi:CHAT domain-containing protein/tetratricopeptide (TPR) repeat protein